MSTNPTTSLVAVLGRLFWMMVGPLALLVTIYFIVSSGTGWRTVADVLYFVILAGMVLGRWIEFRDGSATTADGQPATWADFRRYALLTVTVGPVLWLVANFVGNHLLGQ